MNYQARRQAHASVTRRAILDAAIRLTREADFDKLTIREICTAAGVTTGAFYHHFSSKEDLLSQSFSSLDDYLEEAMAPYCFHPPLDRLELLLRTYAEYMESMGWQTMGLYYSRRLSFPAAASLSPSRYTFKAMLSCFQELSDLGELDEQFDPAWTADFCFRHFRGVVVDWIAHQGSYPLWDKISQDYALFEAAFRS